MGTVTVAIADDYPVQIGNKVLSVGNITMSDSYATSGDTLTAADLGMAGIDGVQLGQGDEGTVLHYDHTNSKILAFQCTVTALDTTTAMAEVSSTTDLSSMVVRYMAVGSKM